MKTLFLLLLGCTSLMQAAGITDAKGYNKSSSMQWQWAANALQKYKWNGEERVLDLGCGDGKITNDIAETRTKGVVVGLDISPTMIQFASDEFAADNLVFIQANMATMNFYQQFDLAVAFCSLHYCVEQEQALKNIHQALKPDGMLLFVGPGLDGTSVGNISEQLVKTEKWAEDFPNFHKQRVYYTLDDYTTLLQQQGFEPVFFNVTYDDLRFVNKEALIIWLKGFVNYLSHLPQAKQDDFLNDIANVMIGYAVPTSDQSLLIKSSLFECLARAK
ncbi:MAG: methyltransferase domain-containing protein [Chlamydiales bacterium]|nr:methyltransferase domain-containing protein [Chlamydiales bacterium]